MSEESPFDLPDFSGEGKAPKKKKKTAPKLSPEQKKRALELIESGMDLMEVTRTVFGDPSLDGRSMEGRLIRSLCKNNGVEYSTSEHYHLPDLELTPAQKDFIGQQIKSGEGMKPFQIATLVFSDRKVKPLSKEYRVVETYIKEEYPETLRAQESLVNCDYTPPKTFHQVMRKVSQISNRVLDENNLANKDKKCIERTLIFLKNSRFVSYANNLQIQGQRDMFEDQFIGTVWDKPDLTHDETNLCVNLCKEYINQIKIEKSIEDLERIIEQLTEDNDGKMAMSIVESINNYRDKLKVSVELQRKINADLNGSRNKRLDSMRQQTISMAQLVEFVREEENRKLYQQATEIRKKLLSETMQNFEDLDAIRARVYGVDKEEISEW